MLREEYGVAKVVSRTKSNYSAPADAHIVAEIKQWDAVISGLGIEAAAHRAVCTTPSLPSDKGSPPSGS